MTEYSFLSFFGLQGVTVHKMDFSQNKPLGGKSGDLNFPSLKGNNSKRLDPTALGEQPYGLFGLTVFSDLTLINPNRKDDKFQILGVLFNVTMTKNIDMVTVQNLDGTIKTHINDGDFDIKIKCWVSTDNANDYPIEAVTQLKDLLKLKTHLEVQSDFLLLFDIYNIVVTDYNIFQVEGVQNTQFFEISAVSDTPVELISDVQTNE
jgi:Domain of unknown function (DUF6046)